MTKQLAENESANYEVSVSAATKLTTNLCRKAIKRLSLLENEVSQYKTLGKGACSKRYGGKLAEAPVEQNPSKSLPNFMLTLIFMHKLCKSDHCVGRAFTAGRISSFVSSDPIESVLLPISHAPVLPSKAANPNSRYVQPQKALR